MSEESIQVFRGSNAPETSFTESRTAATPKPAAGLDEEQQATGDAKAASADAAAIAGDAAGAQAQQGRTEDAAGEQAPEPQPLQHASTPLPASGEPGAADGPSERREWQDTRVPAPPGAAIEDSVTALPAGQAIADSKVMLPPDEGISDSKVMLPPQAGMTDSQAVLPATDATGEGPAGPVQARQLLDSSVPLPASAAQPPQDGMVVSAAGSEGRSGPSEVRQVRDTVAPRPGASFQPDAEPTPPAAASAGEAAAPAGTPELQDAAAAVPTEAAADAVAVAGGISDPDLSFKPHDATPWALSIHLQERIASLGVSTARVGNQLDALEESIKRLGKRIKK